MTVLRAAACFTAMLSLASCAGVSIIPDRYYVIDAAAAAEMAASAEIIVDLRSTEDYQRGHIPKAVSIPYHQLWFRMYELPRNLDALIMAYDDEPSRQARAGEILKKEGYYRVHFVRGGFRAWRAAGGAISESPAPPSVYRFESGS